MLKINSDKTVLLNKIARFSLLFLLYLLLIISLMPIIAWWAGIPGLIFLIYEIARFILPGKISVNGVISGIKSFAEKSSGRIALYIILFGIIIHGACRIHSEILINNLYNEAKTEKNIILGKIPNE